MCQTSLDTKTKKNPLSLSANSIDQLQNIQRFELPELVYQLPACVALRGGILISDFLYSHESVETISNLNSTVQCTISKSISLFLYLQSIRKHVCWLVNVKFVLIPKLFLCRLSEFFAKFIAQWH